MNQLSLFNDRIHKGNESGNRTCSKCKRSLSKKHFSKRGGENYLRTECKSCNKTLSKRRKELREIHGNPPSDYKCPICERTAIECSGEGSNKASAFVIDHCHITDVFRGWLCHKCNRGLGAFNDSVEQLNKAINDLLK